MVDFEHSLTIPAPSKRLFEMSTDFENFGKFFPYLKSVKILEQKDKETITEEILSFTYHKLSHNIVQKTSTKIIDENNISAEVVSGPMKGSSIKTHFENIDDMCKVTVNAKLKTNLKYKFLEPLLKKIMKRTITGILYNMNSEIIKNE